MEKSIGQKKWDKAKSIIPGGNQLLSKRPERFLPDHWPAYYTKASGCEVWDLEDKHYYDFAAMGIGSCVLGYADKDVNKAVISCIEGGNMSTLNTPDEITLAEKLIELNPCGEMVRFARTGGEACAIAARIGRAATGRDLILFCGYHGWHDWYLSSNISDVTNLDDQLLKGLHARGVPKALINTAIPFHYNDLEEFENLISKHGKQVAAIIMEPCRDNLPIPGFLEKIRKRADEIGAVLVFDEISSGFRDAYGGMHLNLGVIPDMALYGKALGNGFPISAIVGKREVMDVAQDTFISSAFWTERIGFNAAMAVLNKMERESVIEQNMKYGNLIKAGWKKVAEENNVAIKLSGLSSVPHFEFDYTNKEAILTLFTQEMLKKGFLASSALYVSFAYSEPIIDMYIEASNEVFVTIKKAIDNHRVEQLLEGPVRNFGFQRLT